VLILEQIAQFLANKYFVGKADKIFESITVAALFDLVNGVLIEEVFSGTNLLLVSFVAPK